MAGPAAAVPRNILQRNRVYLVGQPTGCCLQDPFRVGIMNERLAEYYSMPDAEHMGRPLIVALERLPELVKLQADLASDAPRYFSSTVKSLSSRHPIFLAGSADMKRAGREWADAVRSRRPLFTTSLSLLHILLHGYCRTSDLSAILFLDSLPDSLNQHPVCVFFRLFYWPLAALLFYGGERGLELPSITGFSLVPLSAAFGHLPDTDGAKVLLRHQWEAKLCHLWSMFDSCIQSSADSEHLGGLPVSLPAAQVSPLYNLQFTNVAPGDRTGSLEGDSIDNSGQLVIASSSLGNDPVAIARVLGERHSTAKVTILGAEPKLVGRILDAVLKSQRSESQAGERQVFAVNQRFQTLCSPDVVNLIGEQSEQHLRVGATGALLVPQYALSVLLRFTRALAKQDSSGQSLRGLSVRTLPVRRIDSAGQIVPTDPGQVIGQQHFATEIVLPGRLDMYVDCTVVGDALLSKSEAQSSAAFAAVKLLMEKGLFDDHLLPIESLVESGQLESLDVEPRPGDETVEEEASTSILEIVDSASDSSFVRPRHELAVGLVPEPLQGAPDWQGRYCYAIEYHWVRSPLSDCAEAGDEHSRDGTGASEDASLPLFSQWLLKSGSFMDTTKGLCTFGLVLKEKLPADLPPLFVPLGPGGGQLKCQLVLINDGQPLSSVDNERLRRMQTVLFSLINVRPLNVEELLRKAPGLNDGNELDKPWIRHEQRVVYLLAPLLREGHSLDPLDLGAMLDRFNGRAPPAPASASKWTIDYSFWEKLNGSSSQMTVKELFDRMDTCEKSDPLFRDFVMKSVLLYTPYNGSFYRFQRLYPDLSPASPFESKAVPEASSFFEYIKQRYLPDKSVEEVVPPGCSLSEGPMTGVSRVENYADIAQWTCGEDDFMPNGKRLKREPEHEPVDEEKRKRMALIPWLTRISVVPYWVIRVLLVVPRVSWELERQLLCIDFYKKLSSEGRLLAAGPLPAPLSIQALTAVTAMQHDCNYERLEVLGDTLLKIAVSLDIFCDNRTLGEGRLSQLRQQRISNTNLIRVGRSLGIHRYAHMSPFTPKLWCAPSVPFTPAEAGTATDQYYVHRQRMFDPELKWRLLSDAEHRRDAREAVHDYLVHEKRLLVARDAATAAGQQFPKRADGEKRMGTTSLSRKAIADMVEAVAGAVHELLGMPHALFLLHSLRLLEHPDPAAAYAGVRPLELLGSLLGDPQDRLPARLVPRLDIKAQDWSRPCYGRQQSDGSARHQYGLGVHRGPSVGALFPPNATSDREFDFDFIEGCLGYKFRERTLLFAAFTHVSVDPVHCNERLEWLGDAAIDWLVTRYYYANGRCYNLARESRMMTPYELTEARKASVNNTAFARIVVSMGLYRHMRIAAPDLQAEIHHYQKLFSQGRGGHEERPRVRADSTAYPAPKALGDLFEAVAGAILLDSSLDFSVLDSVYLPLLFPTLERNSDASLIDISAVSRCLEAYARLGIVQPDIRITYEHLAPPASVANDTPEASRRRVCRVTVRGRVVGEAAVPCTLAGGAPAKVKESTVRGRAMAKEAAAQQALDYLLKHGAHSL